MVEIVSLRIKGDLMDKLTASKGDLKLGKCIRLIVEHSANGGVSYLRNVLGTEAYYEKIQAQKEPLDA